MGPERQGAHAIPIRSGEHGQKPLLDVAADVEDDGYFRVVLLGADYAGGVGDPANAKAVEFIRTQIAEWLAWEDIEATQSKEMDSYQQDTVHKRKRDTLKEAQTAVKNAYELVVFLEKDGSVQAKKITMGAQSLFATLLQEPAFRLFRQKIDAEAIMPTGLYPVWPASDPSVRVRDLYQEFGRQPRRPKLLSSRTVLNTIEDAVQGGVLAVRCVRSDGSEQWFWRSMIDITDWQDTAEAWLPAKAKLTSPVAGAVLPSSLKGLWPKEDSGVTIATLCSWFDGNHRYEEETQPGYPPEARPIPQVEPSQVKKAISRAIQEGALWLVFGNESVFAEVPTGLQMDPTRLRDWLERQMVSTSRAGH